MATEKKRTPEKKDQSREKQEKEKDKDKDRDRQTGERSKSGGKRS